MYIPFILIFLGVNNMNFTLQAGLTNYTFKDSQVAFKDAIKQGALEDTNNNNGKYAGDFMYMHTVKNTDYFKNINTRKYIEVTK